MTSVAHEVSRTEERWQSRPVLADLLRGALLAVPLVCSVLVVYAVGSIIPMDQERSWWALTLVLVSAVVTAVVTERITQRLLPLTVLLQLTMLFPDRAPSRLRLARSVVMSPPDELFWSGAGATPTTTADTVLALISALGAHDRKTRGHSERVRVLCDVLAGELKLDRGARDRLRWAALLHDVGKMAVAPTVLNKPAALDHDEFDAIKEHPAMGASIAAPLLPWLGEWGRGILEHHERYDGSGYPSGLAGHEISDAGRIIALVDSFETMTAARAYKKPMATKAAREELARCAGTQFDPVYVRAFLAVSLPRMMWALGPLSFLVHAPFLRSLAEAGARSSAATGQAAASAAGVAVIATAGVGTLATATAEPPGLVAAPPATAQRDVPHAQPRASRTPEPAGNAPTDLGAASGTTSRQVPSAPSADRTRDEATSPGAQPEGVLSTGGPVGSGGQDDRSAGTADRDDVPAAPRTERTRPGDTPKPHSTRPPRTRPTPPAEPPGKPPVKPPVTPPVKPPVRPPVVPKPDVPVLKPPVNVPPVPVTLPTLPPLTPQERRVSIAGAPDTVSTTSTATFLLDTADGLTVQCRDTSGGRSLGGPDSGWRTCGEQVTLTNLKPGQHTFQARSVDATGRKGAVATHTWRVVEDRAVTVKPKDVIEPLEDVAEELFDGPVALAARGVFQGLFGR